jgi:hypothetical protein
MYVFNIKLTLIIMTLTCNAVTYTISFIEFKSDFINN